MTNILQFPARSYVPELVQSLIGESDKRVLARLRGRVTGLEIAEARRDAAELIREQHMDPRDAAACAVCRAMARHDSGVSS